MTRNRGTWFEENGQRLEEESARLEQRGFVLDAAVLAEHRTVRFEGRSGVDARRLLVTFPATFPSQPPIVEDTAESPLLIRHHCSANRHFCLFGPSKVRWSATSNVDAALDEAEDHISRYGPGATIPPGDDVPEPPSASMLYDSAVTVLVPPPISTLDGIAAGAAAGTVHLLPVERGEGTPRWVVVRAALSSHKIDALPAYRALATSEPRQTEGHLLYIPEQLTAQALRDLATRHFNELGAKKPLRANLFLGIAFLEASGRGGGTRIGWVFAMTMARDRFGMVRAFPYVQAERAARIPDLRGLDTRRVAVVGCGCLGSKIAVGLAASGVERFTLVDNDHAEPNNSVRSELAVPLFGLPKPAALRRRILETNPAAFGQINEINLCLGAVNLHAAESHLRDELAAADLILAATGSHGVNRWLNQVACEDRVSALYVSVTNGAWSGEIVRVGPTDACWACWNRQYEDQFPSGAPADAIYPPGCDQPSFTGSSFDTGIVANLASAMAVQTLLGDRFPLPAYPQSYLRWIGRDAAGQPVLKAESLPVDRRPECPFCHDR